MPQSLWLCYYPAVQTGGRAAAKHVYLLSLLRSQQLSCFYNERQCYNKPIFWAIEHFMKLNQNKSFMELLFFFIFRQLRHAGVITYYFTVVI